jgi:hypothetical protein
MADSGKLASFKFGANTYSTANCLQSWDLNSSINDIVYQCNGYDKHLLGTKSLSFRTTMGLAATATTTVIAFAPGTTGAFECHPGGDTAGNIEITATRAQCNVANVTAPMNGVIAMDIELVLDDITYTTAA